MNKVMTIISGIIILVLVVVTFFLVSSMQKGKYEAEMTKVTQDTAVVEEEIRTIKSAKDSNGYLPTDAVRYFVDEIKNDSFEKAKLYVSADKKTKDLKSWLGVTSLDITLTELAYSLEESNSSVTCILTDTGKESSAEFTLIKEDGAWKIDAIEGE